ncbi:MAG TPA: tetratricopeptide repeat protein [Thermoanaerobaculia bacterium]
MSYSVREVSAMLGLSAAQIRDWAARGFLTPERDEDGDLRFGFQDLVILRTAGELTAAKIPTRKIRRVLASVREQLPEGRSIAGVRIAADGERVVVRDGKAIWNPESGQSLFDFSIDEIAEIAEKTKPIALAAVREAKAREENDLDADAWYELASDLELSDPAEARAAYEKAIALDPAHLDAHINLGRLLHEDGDAAAAEKHYRAALAVDPTHPLAAFNLGVALDDLGRLADAADAYRRAIELDPDNPDAHYNLAGILERQHDKAGAVRHLTRYRALTR